MTAPRFIYVFAVLVSAALLLSAGATTARAQQIPESDLLTPNIKEYARPGYPVMTVYVWGNADTGVWRVEEGTDLLEFLSVVSRVRFGEANPERQATELLRLYRDDRPGGEPFFESEIQDLFSERNQYPSLQEGDILVLETKVRTRFTWRDVGRVVGVAGTFFNTWLILDRIRE